MLVRPAARTAAAFLRTYLRLVGPSLRVVFVTHPAYRANVGPLEIVQEVSRKRASGPLIYIVWISDHINLLSLAYAGSNYRALAQAFSFVTDDSFGGIVMSRMLTTFN